ncbi:hypothetical protein D3C71_2155030 [compost metagenome]
MVRANMDEMDVDAVDFGNIIGIGVESFLKLAPVVLVPPMIDQASNAAELSTLRSVPDGLFIRPPRPINPIV